MLDALSFDSALIRQCQSYGCSYTRRASICLIAVEEISTPWSDTSTCEFRLLVLSLAYRATLCTGDSISLGTRARVGDCIAKGRWLCRMVSYIVPVHMFIIVLTAYLAVAHSGRFSGSLEHGIIVHMVHPESKLDGDA